MMTQAERAKQFAPFDAMKGLQEALRDREERHARVERHDISEEDIERNSSVLAKLTKGTRVIIDYYCAFHDITKEGRITEISTAFRYLKLNGEKIFFDDIYYIRITDHSPYGLLKGYGMTETAATLCFSTNRVPEMIPLPRNNIKVLDIDTGKELGYDQDGEICVTSPTLMIGYYKNEDATKEIIFEENGVRWLRTGDLGHITPEGYFHLTGRIKRIFWGIGPDNTPYRIYPMEIERVLCTCPEVENCAVIGKPNGERGYLPIAYVVPAPSADRSRLEEQLGRLCEKELHGNAEPYAYHFIDKLPTTPAGKVDYRTLEQMAAK